MLSQSHLLPKTDTQGGDPAKPPASLAVHSYTSRRLTRPGPAHCGVGAAEAAAAPSRTAGPAGLLLMGESKADNSQDSLQHLVLVFSLHLANKATRARGSAPELHVLSRTCRGHGQPAGLPHIEGSGGLGRPDPHLGELSPAGGHNAQRLKPMLCDPSAIGT